MHGASWRAPARAPNVAGLALRPSPSSPPPHTRTLSRAPHTQIMVDPPSSQVAKTCRAVQRAACVLGPHGGALANAVFLSPGACLIEMGPETSGASLPAPPPPPQPLSGVSPSGSKAPHAWCRCGAAARLLCRAGQWTGGRSVLAGALLHSPMLTTVVVAWAIRYWVGHGVQGQAGPYAHGNFHTARGVVFCCCRSRYQSRLFPTGYRSLRTCPRFWTPRCVPLPPGTLREVACCVCGPLPNPCRSVLLGLVRLGDSYCHHIRQSV